MVGLSFWLERDFNRRFLLFLFRFLLENLRFCGR